MLNKEMIDIMGPAFIAGLVIALTHAPLGIEVLKRGIIFIDLAIAQIAGLGLVAAQVIFHEPSLWILQVIALTCAITAGLSFRFIERILPKQQEAIIGCSFVLAASVVILLLANRPHGGEEIEHLLSGQILFVTWGEVASHLPIYIAILALWFIRPQVRTGIGFYLLFALAITSSVQLVGVYVVFASLILPALSALQTSYKHLVAWGCGILSVFFGIILALWYDVPAGPLLVISYMVVSLIINSISYVKSSIRNKLSF
jgi:zinc/manganese transport system permease protein